MKPNRKMPLLIFIFLIALASRCYPSDIYINNKFYEGEKYLDNGKLWVDAEKVLGLIPLNYEFDSRSRTLFINNNPFPAINIKDGVIFLSLIELASFLSARLAYNKETDTIDFYTFGLRQEKPGQAGQNPPPDLVSRKIKLAYNTKLLVLGTQMIAADVTVTNTGGTTAKDLYVTCLFLDKTSIHEVVSLNTQFIQELKPGDSKTIRCISDIMGLQNPYDILYDITPYDEDEMPASVLKEDGYHTVTITTSVRITHGKKYDGREDNDIYYYRENY
ncbi:MAG: hypothetical protein M1269_01185 [Chloroflexi bacterium]|nr:hypothetical protein [Chloroflexota bacterium]